MDVYLTNARCWLQLKRNERLCELTGLESLLIPCARLDVRLHPGLEPEVGFILDNEYGVARVATEVAWYSPCVMWSRGGASGRSDGRILEWSVEWLWGRGFVGIEL